ncbi:hypothetical protein M422DRAFT_151262 [Sphaerobolus stellatus SS14]|nr:hypothetical protein M422DRAFT_151262 [Sphaerobolus stellatus SS14]
MAGYFNNHTQRLNHAPSSNTTSTTANLRIRAPSSSSNSKHFSTSLSSEEKERDKATGLNGVINGTGSPHSVHPLRNTWVFWFRQQRTPSKVVDYESGIKRIASFASIESFWSLFTHLQPPSILQPTTDYLLFHSGVRRPVWEDPLNLQGGKWIIRLKKGVSDRLWEDLVCAVVGDQFADDGESNGEGVPPGPEVSGCTISVRNSEDILTVWNKGTDPKVKERIRDTIKKVLNLPAGIIMEYKTNSGGHYGVDAALLDSIGDKSSFRNSAIDRIPNEREKP